MLDLSQLIRLHVLTKVWYCSFQVLYKQKHDAEKGISDYAHMKEPPDIKHAMEVNKNQSDVSTPPPHQFKWN